jgi:hypothetical protein
MGHTELAAPLCATRFTGLTGREDTAAARRAATGCRG